MGLLETAKPFGEKTHKFNICLYGEPGIGKSVLAAKAPGAVVLQCERNAALPFVLHEATKGVPVMQLDNAQQAMDLYWEIRKAKWDESQTIVIDTASELQQRHLRETWKTEEAKGKRPDGIAIQKDYLVNTEFMRDVFVSFCDLPCNVIFICHEISDKDEMANTSVTRPSFTPKLGATMFAYVDLMVYMFADINIKGEMKRMARSSPTRSIKAKDRLGLPQLFEADQLWELVLNN